VKIDAAIQDVVELELELAKSLVVVGDRHAGEHDLYQLGRTLARQCTARVERLEPFTDRYGGSADAVAAQPYGTRAKPRAEPAGLVLLRDLRELYLQAHAAEILWVALVQAAKAIRDADLVEVATTCQQEAETCGKWLRTRIKKASPQVFATS
jgi:hypothetical protein